MPLHIYKKIYKIGVFNSLLINILRLGGDMAAASEETGLDSSEIKIHGEAVAKLPQQIKLLKLYQQISNVIQIDLSLIQQEIGALIKKIAEVGESMRPFTDDEGLLFLETLIKLHTIIAKYVLIKLKIDNLYKFCTKSKFSKEEAHLENFKNAIMEDIEDPLICFEKLKKFIFEQKEEGESALIIELAEKFFKACFSSGDNKLLIGFYKAFHRDSFVVKMIKSAENFGLDLNAAIQQCLKDINREELTNDAISNIISYINVSLSGFYGAIEGLAKGKQLQIHGINKVDISSYNTDKIIHQSFIQYLKKKIKSKGEDPYQDLANFLQKTSEVLSFFPKIKALVFNELRVIEEQIEFSFKTIMSYEQNVSNENDWKILFQSLMDFEVSIYKHAILTSRLKKLAAVFQSEGKPTSSYVQSLESLNKFFEFGIVSSYTNKLAAEFSKSFFATKELTILKNLFEILNQNNCVAELLFVAQHVAQSTELFVRQFLKEENETPSVFSLENIKHIASLHYSFLLNLINSVQDVLASNGFKEKLNLKLEGDETETIKLMYATCLKETIMGDKSPEPHDVLSEILQKVIALLSRDREYSKQNILVQFRPGFKDKIKPSVNNLDNITIEVKRNKEGVSNKHAPRYAIIDAHMPPTFRRLQRRHISLETRAKVFLRMPYIVAVVDGVGTTLSLKEIFAVFNDKYANLLKAGIAAEFLLGFVGVLTARYELLHPNEANNKFIRIVEITTDGVIIMAYGLTFCITFYLVDNDPNIDESEFLVNILPGTLSFYVTYVGASLYSLFYLEDRTLRKACELFKNVSDIFLKSLLYSGVFEIAFREVYPLLKVDFAENANRLTYNLLPLGCGGLTALLQYCTSFKNTIHSLMIYFTGTDYSVQLMNNLFFKSGKGMNDSLSDYNDNEIIPDILNLSRMVFWGGVMLYSTYLFAKNMLKVAEIYEFAPMLIAQEVDNINLELMPAGDPELTDYTLMTVNAEEMRKIQASFAATADGSVERDPESERRVLTAFRSYRERERLKHSYTPRSQAADQGIKESLLPERKEPSLKHSANDDENNEDSATVETEGRRSCCNRVGCSIM